MPYIYTLFYQECNFICVCVYVYHLTQRYPDIGKDDTGGSAAVEDVAVGTSTTKLRDQMVRMYYCV